MPDRADIDLIFPIDAAVVGIAATDTASVADSGEQTESYYAYDFAQVETDEPFVVTAAITSADTITCADVPIFGLISAESISLAEIVTVPTAIDAAALADSGATEIHLAEPVTATDVVIIALTSSDAFGCDDNAYAPTAPDTLALTDEAVVGISSTQPITLAETPVVGVFSADMLYLADVGYAPSITEVITVTDAVGERLIEIFDSFSLFEQITDRGLYPGYADTIVCVDGFELARTYEDSATLSDSAFPGWIDSDIASLTDAGIKGAVVEEYPFLTDAGTVSAAALSSADSGFLFEEASPSPTLETSESITCADAAVVSLVIEAADTFSLTEVIGRSLGDFDYYAVSDTSSVPAVTQTSSDAFVLTDGESIPSAAVASSYTFALADSAIISLEILVAESIAAADEVAGLGREILDSFIIQDSASAPDTQLVSQDVFATTEDALPTPSLEAADTLSASETATPEKFLDVADTATASDAVAALTRLVEDTLLATDASTVSLAEQFATDTFTLLVEEMSPNAAISPAEAISATDTSLLNRLVTADDTFSASDAVGELSRIFFDFCDLTDASSPPDAALTSSDAFAALLDDGVSGASHVSSDTFSVSDSALPERGLAVAETFSLADENSPNREWIDYLACTDTAFVLLSVAEAITVTEQALIPGILTDSITVTDAAWSGLPSAEDFFFVDVALVSTAVITTLADSLALLDTATPDVTHASSDAFALADTGLSQPAISAADSLSLTDTAAVSTSLIAEDALRISDTVSFTVSSLVATDNITAADRAVGGLQNALFVTNLSPWLAIGG